MTMRNPRWYFQNYRKAFPAYSQYELPAVDAYRTLFDGSRAQALVGRAMWYMQHGYMVYGSQRYAACGVIDCSNFVRLVYGDFSCRLPSSAARYDSVGHKVEGVYAVRQRESGRYALQGAARLLPGDIFTYWGVGPGGVRVISHVAIYAGLIRGEPWIIQTIARRPTAIGMTKSFANWYGAHFIEARRVLPDSAYRPYRPFILSEPVIPASYILKPQLPVILPSALRNGF